MERRLGHMDCESQTQLCSDIHLLGVLGEITQDWAVQPNGLSLWDGLHPECLYSCPAFFCFHFSFLLVLLGGSSSPQVPVTQEGDQDGA